MNVAQAHRLLMKVSAFCKSTVDRRYSNIKVDMLSVTTRYALGECEIIKGERYNGKILLMIFIEFR